MIFHLFQMFALKWVRLSTNIPPNNAHTLAHFKGTHGSGRLGQDTLTSSRRWSISSIAKQALWHDWQVDREGPTRGLSLLLALTPSRQWRKTGCIGIRRRGTLEGFEANENDGFRYVILWVAGQRGRETLNGSRKCLNNGWQSFTT